MLLKRRQNYTAYGLWQKTELMPTYFKAKNLFLKPLKSKDRQLRYIRCLVNILKEKHLYNAEAIIKKCLNIIKIFKG